MMKRTTGKPDREWGEDLGSRGRSGCAASGDGIACTEPEAAREDVLVMASAPDDQGRPISRDRIERRVGWLGSALGHAGVA